MLIIVVLNYKTYLSVISVLNTVGSVRLSGRFVLIEENLAVTFDQIIELVEKDQFQEAERVARDFNTDNVAYHSDE